MSRIDFCDDRHFLLLATWVGVVGLSIGVRSHAGVERAIQSLRYATCGDRVRPAQHRTRRVYWSDCTVHFKDYVKITQLNQCLQQRIYVLYTEENK